MYLVQRSRRREAMTSRNLEFLEEIRFEDFCAGNDKEELVTGLSFRFKGEW